MTLLAGGFDVVDRFIFIGVLLPSSESICYKFSPVWAGQRLIQKGIPAFHQSASGVDSE